MAERGGATDHQIRELKVTGHTMALDPGLYCVFNAPGSPAPDSAGLPGVRITAAPAARHGTIEVSGFAPDGWIGSQSAALVRVTEVRSELMVTVYQSPGSQAEAPKLQVVLVAPAQGQAAQAPTQPPAQAAAAPHQQATAPVQAQPATAAQQPNDPIEVVAHVYGKGDQAGRLGTRMGQPGSQRWIEGFGIAPPDGIGAADIEYQAVLGRGWLSPWSEGGQFCGSRGMSLPILGMRVRLREAAAKTHRVVLSATFVDGTEIGPVGDGEPCEAASLAALESFVVRLEPIATADAAAKDPAQAAPARAGKVRGKAAKVQAEAAPAEQPVAEAPAKPTARRGKAAAPVAPAAPTPAPVAAAKSPGRRAAAKAPEPAPEPPARPAKAVRAPAAGKQAAEKPATGKPATGKPTATPAKRAPAKRTPPTTRRR